MSELKGLFEKIKIENLMAFLIYGTDSGGEMVDNYDRKIEESYDDILLELERKYPELDRNDDELLNIITDFAAIHDYVYFESGVMAGFQLYKNMDQVYKKHSDGDMESILNISERKKKPDIEKTYRDKTDEKVSGLDKENFTSEQWEMIEDVLFMKTEKGAEYGKAAYHRGFSDALKFMRDMFKTM